MREILMYASGLRCWHVCILIIPCIVKSNDDHINVSSILIIETNHIKMLRIHNR